MIPYFGGKSYLAPWIIAHFPENYEHLTYCEIFGGGGWVLFKKSPSELEIYNDLNSDLVNLFKVIRDQFEAFHYRAEWTLHSRAMFEEAKEKLAHTELLSEIERALHYAVIRTQSFSGTGSTWAYIASPPHLYSGKWLPFLKKLELINARLKRVQIECLDFEKVIRKYDSKNTLFYLDPPYMEREYYYRTKEVDFKKEDHVRLSNLLKHIKGKFVLSYYEHPWVRKTYNKFHIIRKVMPKFSARITQKTYLKNKPTGTELLIMNY